MKIALVAPSYLSRPGILERHVHELAARLTVRGVEVEVFTQDSRLGVPPVSEFDGFRVTRFGAALGNRQVAVAPRLWDHLRRAATSYDLVHVHSAYTSLPLAAARARPRRLVFTPYAPVQRLLRRPYGGLLRALLHQGAHILCVSETESKVLKSMYPMAADRIGVAALGVDIEAIQAARPFFGQGTVVVATGPLERHRGIDKAIASVAALEPGVRLAVIGDGPDRGRLVARAADLRVSASVHFVGAASDPDLYRWLRTASVVVALAQEDPAGHHVTQALSGGAPVVASDIPVHREAAARAGSAGVTFVSPAGSPLDVADGIYQATGRRVPTTRRLKLPSWDEAVDRTLAAYGEIVRGS